MVTFLSLVHGDVSVLGILIRSYFWFMDTFLSLVYAYIFFSGTWTFFISGTSIRSFLSLVHGYIPISST